MKYVLNVKWLYLRHGFVDFRKYEDNFLPWIDPLRRSTASRRRREITVHSIGLAERKLPRRGGVVDWSGG
jgi:hypothetical protein